jgi:L-iditol 2-dehydrogenase
MREMYALVRGCEGVVLERRHAPDPRPDEVAIDVAFAGVCRTDLAVADGSAPSAPRVVLGHELAGRIAAIGCAVRGLKLGQPVSAVPFIESRWLGIDLDGAFAERVCVPVRCLVRLPDTMPLLRAVYVEPLAAALGSLPAIARGARVRIGGAGRIAELTSRVVSAHGAHVVHEGPCDVAIEHDGNAGALIAALRRGGTLVLKSRARRALALDAGEIVERELIVRGASHGSFDAAVDWLHAGRVVIDDLLAPPRTLNEFEGVLAAARASEREKQVFEIVPSLERGRCAA